MTRKHFMQASFSLVLTADWKEKPTSYKNMKFTVLPIPLGGRRYNHTSDIWSVGEFLCTSTQTEGPLIKFAFHFFLLGFFERLNHF